MARILIPSPSDRRDKRGLQAAETGAESSAGYQRDRPRDDDGRRVGPNPRIRRLAVIVPTRRYRDVSG